jgi:hypothetical protein
MAFIYGCMENGDKTNGQMQVGSPVLEVSQQMQVNNQPLDQEPYNILVLSELAGGTQYMFRDGLIGISHYIKNAPNKDKPKMAVIIGGMATIAINRGGPRNEDRLHVIVDGVNNRDELVAVIKQDFKRLLASLPQNCKVVYAFSKNEWQNIEDQKRAFRKLFVKAQSSLIKKNNAFNYNLIDPLIDQIEVEIKTREDILKSLVTERNHMRKELSKKSAKRAYLTVELANIVRNMRINHEELKDLKERLLLYRNLSNMVYKKIPITNIVEALSKARKEHSAIREKLKNTPTDSPEYEVTIKKAKFLGNTIRELTKVRKSAVTSGTVKEMLKTFDRTEIFGGNPPIPKKETDIIHKIVMLEMKSLIKEMSDWDKRVIVQYEKSNVYSKRKGNFSFNVIVTDGLDMASSELKKTSNSSLVPNNFILTTNLGGKVKKKLETTPLNVLVGGKNGYTSYSMVPWADKSMSTLVALAKGPFFDVEKLAQMYISNYKTEDTMAVQKMVLDSTASIIQVFGKDNVTHKLLTKEGLKDERIKADIEQKQALEDVLKRFHTNTNSIESQKKEKEKFGLSNPELAKAILSSHLPSEIKDKDLLYADNTLIKSLVPNAYSEMPEAPAEIRVASFSDVHAGEDSDLTLYAAAAEHARKFKPHIIEFRGDVHSGDLGHSKYVPRPETEHGVYEQFENYMRKEGMPEETIKKELLKRFKHQHDNIVWNMDEQLPLLFPNSMKKLLVETLHRGGYIIAVSGNHYQGSKGAEQRDESTAIYNSIMIFLEGYILGGEKFGKLPEDWKIRIKRGGGSYVSIGAEKFTLNNTDYEVRHKLANNPAKIASSNVSKRTLAASIHIGHGHQAVQTITNQTIVTEAPDFQNDTGNPFGKYMASPVAPENKFNGYLQEVIKIKDGELREHVYKPILREQLSVNDKIFTEFLRDKMDMQTGDMPMRKKQTT